jgi:hypothetical protein
VPVAEEPVIVQADSKGNYKLDANDAELHGDKIKVEMRGVHANIGFWDKANEWASWRVQFDKPGKYKISLNLSTVHAGAEFVVEIAGKKLAGKAPQTGDWEKFQGCGVGQIEINSPGIQTLSVRAKNADGWKAINLRDVRLTPTE